MEALSGTWTYRSFLNESDPVTSAARAQQLILGEGELAVEQATEGRTFRATLSFGDDQVMDLEGSVSPAGAWPVTITARGRGRPGGPVAHHAYDYLFYLVPDWAEGVAQRDVLVGSVLRLADHGVARKGMTASTISVRRGS